jgi:hypothetical protein
MKKLHKLAAAVAVAAGIALSPQANAIEMETNGVGDALLFPVFAAGAGLYENYFTINNSSADWIQGHLRFRGAAWSAELLDFDIILSPGDVFVFRLADVDGDGLWEVDGRLDPRNFQYTGMVFSCVGPDGATISPCINPDNMLEPNAAGITQATTAGIANIAQQIALQRSWGYVEFIGEAVLQGMNDNIMNVLMSGTPGDAWVNYVTENGNRRGTNTWRWSDAAGGFRACPANNPCDRGLGDVPNVLSGTAFITVPGQVSGIAYNAEALIDFRTVNHPHRLDNYSRVNTLGAVAGAANLAPQNSVILHHESAASPANGVTPFGDYVYACCGVEENRDDEAVISYNNTWGPTLADGDDYLPTSIPALDRSVIPGLPAPANSVANAAPVNDAFDALRVSYTPVTAGPTWARPTNNSISEVEMAIRNASIGQNDVFLPLLRGGVDNVRGQVFTSYYSDNDRFDKSPAGQSGTGNLNSTFLGFFPTKYFYAENRGTVRAAGRTPQDYINLSVIRMLQLAKPIAVEVWDATEKPCTCTNAKISPARTESCDRALGQELNTWDIDWLKQSFTDAGCPTYRNGRTVIMLGTNSSPNPLAAQGVTDGYPGLLYTFDVTNTGNLAHWRSMQKR